MSAAYTEYKRRIYMRNTAVAAVGVVLLVAALVVSMNTGYTKLSPSDTFRIFLGGGTDAENLVLFQFRLPRVIFAAMAGAGLALSGCIIQDVAKNPLADPGLLGINAGAGLAVLLYVLFFGTTTYLAVFTLPLLALAGAGVTSVLIYLLAFKAGEEISPVRLILTGIAVQAGIFALTTVLVINLDETQFDFVAMWQAGSIWGSGWKYVLALLPWQAVLVPFVVYKSRVLDVLSLDSGAACSLGVGVEREQRTLLFCAVALAASCVAVSGNISFAGLIAPHMARRLVGPRHSVLLPVCALTGAVMVSAADTFARVIVQPSEIPTGIVTAVIGAPYFIWLMTKK